MRTVNLEQFRAAIEAGGVVGVTLVGQGGAFGIEAHTRAGDRMWLATQRNPSPRLFRDLNRATRLLLELGVRRWDTDASQYRPEEGELLKHRRPDRSAAMKAMHVAARQFPPEVHQLVAERQARSRQPDAEFHDHDTVFDELERRLSGRDA